MEWHGEKLLPRGLPELVYEITPNWILPNLKVIAHPRKTTQRCFLGRVWWPDWRVDNWWRVELFPTRILWKARRDDLSVISFSFWQEFLRVMLHEIGHIATRAKSIKTFDQRSWRSSEDYNHYRHVEWMADVWCQETMEKIAIRDPRLGQPKGWIGGLSGIYLRRYIDLCKTKSKDFRSPADLWLVHRWSGYKSPVAMMLINYRAYNCDGQRTLTEILRLFVRDYLGLSLCSLPYHARRLRKQVKLISSELGITRHHIDSNGRKHLFFNHGESIAVINELRRYVLEKNLMDSIVREANRHEDIEIVREAISHEERVETISQLLEYGKKRLAECDPRLSFPLL
jgi:hypothetical protein